MTAAVINELGRPGVLVHGVAIHPGKPTILAAAGGKPVFGLPGGPKGLLHRFFQGFLYPAFTGGTVTHFRSPEAVTMWEYMKDLWAQCVPASTNFEFMQEPLASKQVQVAWDHVARLVEAPKDEPDDFVMAPVPAGPKGRAYMSVLGALAIPKGAPRKDETEKLIEGLSKPDVQIEVLRQNAFFPAVNVTVPADLPPAVKLEAQAVKQQQSAPDAVIALVPVGLKGKDGDLNQVFKDVFTNIVLKNKPIQSTLDQQAKILQGILDEAKAACWKPDPDSAGATCQVG
jgi:multiple sugar transport system substrate-binding protein